MSSHHNRKLPAQGANVQRSQTLRFENPLCINGSTLRKPKRPKSRPKALYVAINIFAENVQAQTPQCYFLQTHPAFCGVTFDALLDACIEVIYHRSLIIVAIPPRPEKQGKCFYAIRLMKAILRVLSPLSLSYVLPFQVRELLSLSYTAEWCVSKN
jgi:hypothetical protein